MTIARVLLVTTLLLVACTGGSDAISTTLGSTEPDRTDEIAQLQADMVAALADLEAAEDDRDDLEREVARLEAERTVAREEARRSAAAAALAVGSLEQLESLIADLRLEFCPADSPTAPTSLATDLMDWLIETQSDAGEIPAGTEAVIGSAISAEGWWLFQAEFTGRFEPGVFALDPDGDFAVVWGGIADSEAVIRAWIHGTVPEMPAALALCLDVAGFVDPSD